MRAGSGGEGGNCIAVVVRAHLTEENVPPMAALGGATASLSVGLPAAWLKTAAQENRRERSVVSSARWG